jgi:hypothetical protein
MFAALVLAGLPEEQWSVHLEPQDVEPAQVSRNMRNNIASYILNNSSVTIEESEEAK